MMELLEAEKRRFVNKKAQNGDGLVAEAATNRMLPAKYIFFPPIL